MNIELIEKIIKSKKKLVLATVLEVNGSAPRHSGSKMLISKNGIEWGSIGGGNAEQIVLEKIKKMFQKNLIKNNIEIINIFMKGKNIYEKKMLCGGQIKILINFIDEKQKISFQKIKEFLISGYAVEFVKNLNNGNIITIKKINLNKINFKKSILQNKKKLFYDIVLPQKKLFLFGAGHINKEVYKIALNLDFEIIIIDDRKEYANYKHFPKAKKIIVDKFPNVFDKIYFNELSYIIIATKSHLDDINVLKQILKRKSIYIGCIGSKNKIKTIKEGLKKEGFDNSLIKRLHAPIGLNIGAETPIEIAISILAEIIGIKNEKKSN